MSERYQRLFLLPKNLYVSTAPVIIAAGALLKDTQTGKILVQIKFQNVNKKRIKALTVKIKPLDTIGNPLGEEVEYQYLDLTAERDAFFGQKVPIPLPDDATRAFSIIVSEVIFEDNSVWSGTTEPWESLSSPTPLEQALNNWELAKEYRIQYGKDCDYLFKTEKDLWYCACGALNHTTEEKCHLCQKETSILSTFNRKILEKKKDERIIKEKFDEEKRNKEMEAATKSKKQAQKKQALLLIPIIIIIAIIGALISSNGEKKEAYNNALSLVESQKYDEAISAFKELGDYKDSKEQISNIKTEQLYTEACKSSHDTAITLFTELGDYKDSKDRLAAAKVLQQLDNYWKSLKNNSAPIDFEKVSEILKQAPPENSDAFQYSDLKDIKESIDILPYFCGNFKSISGDPNLISKVLVNEGIIPTEQYILNVGFNSFFYIELVNVDKSYQLFYWDGIFFREFTSHYEHRIGLNSKRNVVIAEIENGKIINTCELEKIK